MKGKTSSIFKKVLQDSGFDSQIFDTIPEVENEELGEECKENSATVENSDGKESQVRRPVSPKRVRKISLYARKLSVPNEVWLNKTPRKQCEIRHVNKTLNNTLNLLLQRTNSLTEELNRGRKAIEQCLDTGNASKDGKKMKDVEQKEGYTKTTPSNVLNKRERQNRPTIAQRGVTKRDIQKPDKQETFPADKNHGHSTIAVPDIKQEISPRLNHVNFSVKDSKSSTKTGQTSSLTPEVTTKLRGAASLPNLKAVHFPQKPRSKSFHDVNSKTETGKNLPLQGVSQNRHGLISLRPPPVKTDIRRSPLLQTQDAGKDDSESCSSRSTKSSTTTVSSKSEKIQRKQTRRQCYKTESGEMVKMSNLFSLISNESVQKESQSAEELTWFQIRHCRYLRNHIASPDFCTCNQCESFKRE